MKEKSEIMKSLYYRKTLFVDKSIFCIMENEKEDEIHSKEQNKLCLRSSMFPNVPPYLSFLSVDEEIVQRSKSVMIYIQEF